MGTVEAGAEGGEADLREDLGEEEALAVVAAAVAAARLLGGRPVAVRRARRVDEAPPAAGSPLWAVAGRLEQASGSRSFPARRGGR